jgi:hypothetical protein
LKSHWRSKPSIGIELGFQTEPDDFGALVHALYCAPSVEKALKTLHQFIVVFAQESHFDYDVEGNSLIVEYPSPD